MAGDTTRRGYGAPHKAERARLAPIVARGGVVCAKCGTYIEPGTAWDLGHTDDRSEWTGPEHAHCNRSAAAYKRNALARLRRHGSGRDAPAIRPERDW